MKLDPIETRSAAWMKVEHFLRERLEVLRCRNDGALTVEETSNLRGRIAQVKEILALGLPEPDDGVVTHSAAAVLGDPFGVES